MKKTLLLLVIIFFYASSYSQDSIHLNKRIESLGYFWGVLKYYHPAITKGKVDWDEELVNHLLPSIQKLYTKQELNDFYLDYLKKLKKIEKKGEHLNVDTNFFPWLSDTVVFSEQLKNQLGLIIQSKKKELNCFLRLSMSGYKSSTVPILRNEKQYLNLKELPDENYRILTLFRFWNYINYFYPYKKLLDCRWDTVLSYYIPLFVSSNSELQYHLTLLDIVNKLDDSHSSFWSKTLMNKYFGMYDVPFETIIVNDTTLIISNITNDSLARLDDIQIGDIIFQIEQKPTVKVIKDKIKYINGSNTSAKLRNLNYTILNGFGNVLNVGIKRNEKLYNKSIKRYKNINFFDAKSLNTTPYYKIGDSIGYVDLGLLHKSHVNKMFKSFKHTKGIIFDLRKYPNGTLQKLAKHLCKEKIKLAKIENPMYNFEQNANKYWYSYCGKRNHKYYKGKTVVLINENTQSQGEYTCMMFKALNSATFVGSQTAGADGDLLVLPFTSGNVVPISYVRISYPNGKETQRIGITPDITVIPAIDGIINKKDEILETAISFINN